MPGPRLLVTADDRTGAMESAALCADAGLMPVWVLAFGGTTSPQRGAHVVDLRTRHLSPARAAARVVETVRLPAEHRVHKIDSTLRGNWASELGAIAAAGCKVVLVPAYPAAGRTCVGGTVLVDGVPVADTGFGRDPTSPVRSSRPADLLAAATEHARRVEIDDATTDADIDAIVAERIGEPGTLMAGPAAVVGSVARHLGATAPAAPPALPRGEVLVVCGSRHDASRAQAEAVLERPDVTVLTPMPDLRADREVVALELAFRAHEHLGAHPTAVVVLLGGDTADAFLTDRPVRVHGSVGVGTALGTVDIDGRPIAVVTKPGGFGSPGALAVLLDARTP